MNLKLIGFTKTGHNVVEDSSATQVNSQTPIATILSTGEAGKIEGEYFGSIASFFESLEIWIHEFETNWFTKTGHKGAQDSSDTQVSSQTPLRTIMTTTQAGEIKSAYFSNIILFFESNRLINRLGFPKDQLIKFWFCGHNLPTLDSQWSGQRW